MKPILEIQNLSKRFMIGHESEPYLSLRERLTSGFKFSKRTQEEFWALKNVNFDINPGDSVGIIGKNGAGKSTLLKILSRITPPTTGRVICRGRIASLLEVGTGFHPELSGRENVYLNGSILGMKRREIDVHFDEIIAFAGTEQFLDTPLKHYSSGMQLRLAFSVAAFLEPEILVIDEVLAVGDAEFQKKCMGKMEDVSKSGRTILFVSHNMEAIRNLCSRVFLLSHGEIESSGDTSQVIDYYLGKQSAEQRTSFKPGKPLGSKGIQLSQCSARTSDPQPHTFTNGQPIHVGFHLMNQSKKSFSVFLFVFRDESLAFISSDLHDPCAAKLNDQNEFEIIFEIPPYLLNPGMCRIGLMIADSHGNIEQYFNEMDLLSFSVEDDGFRRGGKYNLGWSGAVSPVMKVNVSPV